MNSQTDVAEFIFLGFSHHPNLQGLFFLVFLVIYLTTLQEHTHNNGHKSQSCPPQPNVLFPQQPEFLGHLLHIYHYSSHVGELIPGQEDHLL